MKSSELPRREDLMGREAEDPLQAFIKRHAPMLDDSIAVSHEWYRDLAAAVTHVELARQHKPDAVRFADPMPEPGGMLYRRERVLGRDVEEGWLGVWLTRHGNMLIIWDKFRTPDNEGEWYAEYSVVRVIPASQQAEAIEHAVARWLARSAQP